uniref:Uncharacterized protein n=1 Tax=viral metagenome TaxID=1070528 RepID=A0A6C0F5N6_9ZZZZ|tara:strand:+ start:12475 stop:12789 length:315 start_codon:yes stop_codon:yes gene_type:complete
MEDILCDDLMRNINIMKCKHELYDELNALVMLVIQENKEKGVNINIKKLSNSLQILKVKEKRDNFIQKLTNRIKQNDEYNNSEYGNNILKLCENIVMKIILLKE